MLGLGGPHWILAVAEAGGGANYSPEPSFTYLWVPRISAFSLQRNSLKPILSRRLRAEVSIMAPSDLLEGTTAGDEEARPTPKKPKRFQCRRCQRLFARLEHLQRHERTRKQHLTGS